ncbi:MAG: hypothetical protein AAGU11_08060 [Syntrophobacteraceae bacterium]
MRMDYPAPTEEERSPILTWGIIVGIGTSFLLWGLLVFFVIGDKGPPEWDFSIIPDVPGESAYSTHSSMRPHGLVPPPIPLQPQHVMEPGTDFHRSKKEAATK